MKRKRNGILLATTAILVLLSTKTAVALPLWAKIVIGVFTLGLGLLFGMSDDAICTFKRGDIVVWEGNCKDIKNLSKKITSNAVCIAESKDKADCYTPHTCSYNRKSLSCADLKAKLDANVKAMVEGNLRCHYVSWPPNETNLWCQEYECIEFTGLRRPCGAHPEEGFLSAYHCTRKDAVERYCDFPPCDC